MLSGLYDRGEGGEKGGALIFCFTFIFLSATFREGAGKEFGCVSSIMFGGGVETAIAARGSEDAEMAVTPFGLGLNFTPKVDTTRVPGDEPPPAPNHDPLYNPSTVQERDNSNAGK